MARSGPISSTAKIATMGVKGEEPIADWLFVGLQKITRRSDPFYSLNDPIKYDEIWNPNKVELINKIIRNYQDAMEDYVKKLNWENNPTWIQKHQRYAEYLRHSTALNDKDRAARIFLHLINEFYKELEKNPGKDFSDSKNSDAIYLDATPSIRESFEVQPKDPDILAAFPIRAKPQPKGPFVPTITEEEKAKQQQAREQCCQNLIDIIHDMKKNYKSKTFGDHSQIIKELADIADAKLNPNEKYKKLIEKLCDIWRKEVNAVESSMNPFEPKLSSKSKYPFDTPQKFAAWETVAQDRLRDYQLDVAMIKRLNGTEKESFMRTIGMLLRIAAKWNEDIYRIPKDFRENNYAGDVGMMQQPMSKEALMDIPFVFHPNYIDITNFKPLQLNAKSIFGIQAIMDKHIIDGIHTKAEKDRVKVIGEGDITSAEKFLAQQTAVSSAVEASMTSKSVAKK